ncbi:hypothetical protein [Pseudomonas sp.]|uniref:hypothetical protein n=1 Tax=Pseudomonas sp. TaxID=306 RepID=UPI002729EFFE|nr:hypothetical protein [Pseudomonas sp.]
MTMISEIQDDESLRERVRMLMGSTVRGLLIALLASTLLTFSSLASALLNIDRCLAVQDEPASLHHDCSGAETHSDWLESAAQLLCDSGLDCQLSAAVLPSSAMLAGACPAPRPFATLATSVALAAPQSCWRPPRG